MQSDLYHSSSATHPLPLTLRHSPSAPHPLPLILCHSCCHVSLAEAACPLTLKQRLDILIGMARGFEYLHGFGIMHRDIKPTNVLITDNMQASLVTVGPLCI
ncbi:unnamed protein product [Closterium sp. NIES-54]